MTCPMVMPCIPGAPTCPACTTPGGPANDGERNFTALAVFDDETIQLKVIAPTLEQAKHAVRAELARRGLGDFTIRYVTSAP